jgi:hypothetical protein
VMMLVRSASDATAGASRTELYGHPAAEASNTQVLESLAKSKAAVKEQVIAEIHAKAKAGDSAGVAKVLEKLELSERLAREAALKTLAPNGIPPHPSAAPPSQNRSRDGSSAGRDEPRIKTTTTTKNNTSTSGNKALIKSLEKVPRWFGKNIDLFFAYLHPKLASTATPLSTRALHSLLNPKPYIPNPKSLPAQGPCMVFRRRYGVWP